MSDDLAVRLEALKIGSRPGEPIEAESVAKDLETMARKVRAAGVPVLFSLAVRWPKTKVKP